MAKRKVNKTQAIRDALAADPHASPKALAESLTKRGIKVSPQYVSTVKFSMKNKQPGRKKKGRAAKELHASVAALVQAKKARRATWWRPAGEGRRGCLGQAAMALSASDSGRSVAFRRSALHLVGRRQVGQLDAVLATRTRVRATRKRSCGHLFRHVSWRGSATNKRTRRLPSNNRYNAVR